MIELSFQTTKMRLHIVDGWVTLSSCPLHDKSVYLRPANLRNAEEYHYITVSSNKRKTNLHSDATFMIKDTRNILYKGLLLASVDTWWHFGTFFFSWPEELARNLSETATFIFAMIACGDWHCAQKVSLNLRTDSNKRGAFPNRVLLNW